MVGGLVGGGGGERGKNKLFVQNGCSMLGGSFQHYAFHIAILGNILSSCSIHAFYFYIFKFCSPVKVDGSSKLLHELDTNETF